MLPFGPNDTPRRPKSPYWVMLSLFMNYFWSVLATSGRSPHSVGVIRIFVGSTPTRLFGVNADLAGVPPPNNYWARLNHFGLHPPKKVVLGQL